MDQTLVITRLKRPWLAMTVTTNVIQTIEMAGFKITCFISWRAGARELMILPSIIRITSKALALLKRGGSHFKQCLPDYPQRPLILKLAMPGSQRQKIYTARIPKRRGRVTLAWYAVGIGDIADLWHSPADGDKNVAPWPAALEWEDQSDEIEWQVQASTSPNFDRDLVTKQTSVGTRPPNGSFFSTVNVNLKPNTNYYWRVRAKRNPSSSGNNGGSKIIAQPAQGGSPTLQTGWGDWSLLRYFKTDKRASTLKSPVETGTKIYPWGGDEFKWTGVDGGKEYWLQTSENKDLGIASNVGPGHATQGSSIQNIQPNNPLQSILLDGVFVDPNDPDHTEGSNRIKDVLPFALKVNHTYYWGVLPYGPENIQGDWSNHQQGQIFQTSTPRTKLTVARERREGFPVGNQIAVGRDTGSCWLHSEGFKAPELF